MDWRFHSKINFIILVESLNLQVSLLFGRMAGWILWPELNRLLDQSTVIELGAHLKR